MKVLALSLVVSVHKTSFRFLNLCIDYLLTTVGLLMSIFVASLIVRCLYMNLIILVLCSAFDLILIPFILPLLAHYYYYTSIKITWFSFIFIAAPHLWNHLPHNIHTAPTYRPMSFRKNLKIYAFIKT